MKRKFLLAAAALAAALSFALNSQAVTCYAVNESNVLYKFDSATPGTTTSQLISGLMMGYRVVGLDFRITTQVNGAANPGVGSLWALATNGGSIQVYSIAPATAAATYIGTLAGIDTAGSDNGWFFGFDPARDRLRVMNSVNNYEVNPNTLAVTAQTRFDQATNPNKFPDLNGSAYTTASFGGTNQIYFLEQNNLGLNTSTNIASGVYTALPTPLNVAFVQPAGLDIDGSLILAACFNTIGNKQTLFSVTTSGVFTSLGDISATPATLSLRALAIQPTSFPPVLSVTVKVNKTPKKTAKAKLVIKGTAASGAGISLVQVQVGKASFKNASGTTGWTFPAKLKRGKNVISVRAQGGNGAFSTVAKVTIKRK